METFALAGGECILARPLAQAENFMATFQQKVAQVGIVSTDRINLQIKPATTLVRASVSRSE